LEINLAGHDDRQSRFVALFNQTVARLTQQSTNSICLRAVIKADVTLLHEHHSTAFTRVSRVSYHLSVFVNRDAVSSNFATNRITVSAVAVSSVFTGLCSSKLADGLSFFAAGARLKPTRFRWIRGAWPCVIARLALCHQTVGRVVSSVEIRDRLLPLAPRTGLGAAGSTRHMTVAATGHVNSDQKEAGHAMGPDSISRSG
jgi:hypothetical protein